MSRPTAPARSSLRLPMPAMLRVREPPRALPAGGPHSGRRREPAHASAAGADVGHVLSQLGERCPDRVSLAALSPAQAAAPRQPGGRAQQRRRACRVALSGGFAGAKATQRFMTGYAQDEADRAGLGITFTAVLPKITPLTDLGRPAIEAYAVRAGHSVEEHVEQLGPLVTPEIAGAALVELVQADAATVAPGYLLTGAGLQRLP